MYPASREVKNACCKVICVEQAHGVQKCGHKLISNSLLLSCLSKLGKRINYIKSVTDWPLGMERKARSLPHSLHQKIEIDLGVKY